MSGEPNLDATAKARGTEMTWLVLTLSVILVALSAASGATAAGNSIRSCGNIPNTFVVNVTTRNVSCRDARSWMIREFEKNQNLGSGHMWWRRFGNHVPVCWRCQSRLTNGRTDI